MFFRFVVARSDGMNKKLVYTKRFTTLHFLTVPKTSGNVLASVHRFSFQRKPVIRRNKPDLLVRLPRKLTGFSGFVNHDFHYSKNHMKNCLFL
jgi:hypothetical protein